MDDSVCSNNSLLVRPSNLVQNQQCAGQPGGRGLEDGRTDNPCWGGDDPGSESGNIVGPRH